jgi:hypothetical protein
MQADLYRYKHKFYDLEKLNTIQSTYTLDDLRLMLKGKTWEDVVKMSIATFGIEGVHFTARMGTFLRRKAIAVCAMDKIIAMRFVTNTAISPNWGFESLLDGGSHSGFVLMPGDFTNGRLGDIKLTDLVLGDDIDA